MCKLANPTKNYFQASSDSERDSSKATPPSLSERYIKHVQVIFGNMARSAESVGGPCRRALKKARRREDLPLSYPGH